MSGQRRYPPELRERARRTRVARVTATEERAPSRTIPALRGSAGVRGSAPETTREPTAIRTPEYAHPGEP